jgi:DNA polymerase III sliding clamp (beta) subunit (PCNA family)
MSDNQVFNITIASKELAKTLNICNQVSPRKSDVDLFTYTKISLDNKGIHFASSNGNTFYISTLKLENTLEERENEISFLVKTDQFYTLVSIMNDQNIDLIIDLTKLTMVIKGEKSKHQLRITKENENTFYIPTPNDSNQQFTVSVLASEVLEANRVANLAVGQKIFDTTYLQICYIIKPLQKQINVMATDRFRIAKSIIDCDFTFINEALAEQNINYLIMPKTLQLLSSAVEKAEKINFTFENEALYCKLDNATLITKYGEGKFADLDKIIPQSFTCVFTANTQEFLKGLKQVSWCVKSDINHIINLALTPVDKIITLTSKNSDGEEAQYIVELDNYEGPDEPWNQSFNADFLIDYINFIKTDTFLYESNPGRPVVLSQKDMKDKQFYMVSGLK